MKKIFALVVVVWCQFITFATTVVHATEPFSSPGIRTSDVEGSIGYATANGSTPAIITATIGGYSQAAINYSVAYYGDLYQWCVDHDAPLCSCSLGCASDDTCAIHLKEYILSNYLYYWPGDFCAVIFPDQKNRLYLFGHTSPCSYCNTELTSFLDCFEINSQGKEIFRWKNWREQRVYSHPVIGAFAYWLNPMNSKPFEENRLGHGMDYSTMTEVALFRLGKFYPSQPTEVTCDGVEHGMLPVNKCRDDAVLYRIMGFITPENCCKYNENKISKIYPSITYANQFDWFCITDSDKYDYIRFTTTKLEDVYDVGSIYVVTNNSIAKTCTNFTVLVGNANAVCSLSNAKNGFNFCTGQQKNVMMCVAHPDFDFATKTHNYTFQDYVYYERNDSPQKWNRITKYRFKLESGTKPSDPDPGTSEVFSPLIYTNTYLVTSSDILVYEDDPVTISITPKSTNPSDVMFHFVENDTEVSHVTIPANSSDKVAVDYAPKFDPNFNEDHYRTLHVKNYSMDASMNIMVRDIMVEHTATERHYYDDDGVRFFPETGNWFVDRDYLLRSENPSADDVSVVLNFTKSGQMKITADDSFQVREAEAFVERSVIQTNYVKNASEKHVRHIDTMKAKIPSSFKLGTASGKSYDVSVTSNTVLRISTKNGNKFSVFSLQ